MSSNEKDGKISPGAPRGQKAVARRPLRAAMTGQTVLVFCGSRPAPSSARDKKASGTEDHLPEAAPGKRGG